MSVTTTDNARMVTVRHMLADYELHHSQPADSDAAPAPAPNNTSQSQEQNPADWEHRWRRVPAYRPAANQLDEQRNTYQNAIEQNFVRVMFGGVSMMAGASQIWRATGGTWNSTFFQYKIGGEW